jgi:LysM repeat protein
LWGAVGVLIFAGVVVMVIWLMKPDSPVMQMLATATPTFTVTPSPTNTSTPTQTPTQTSTATVTPSPTASAPFKYTVQSGDSLTVIAQKFNLGDNGIPLLLFLNQYTPAKGGNAAIGIDPTTGIVYPGMIITIPNPGYPLPSATPVPTNLARGTKVTYTIQAGDTLQHIASLFNSTVEDILLQNPEIKNGNSIQVGQQITVRANLVTPTPAPKPTITQGPSPTPPSPYTATPSSGGGSNPTPTVTVTLTPTP